MLADVDRCACGQSYSNCAIWRAVRERTAIIDRRRMLDLDRRVLLTRRLRRAGGDADDARAYRATLGDLYDSVRAVTGARLIVDTSKAPSYALALASLHNVELSVVHLIRDPRATAFSRRSDPMGVDVGLLGSAMLWNSWNILAEQWFRKHHHYLRIRYEDFADRPRETVMNVLDLIGEARDRLPVTADGHAVLAENHSVAGNKARFRSGEVRVERDDAWGHLSRGRDQAVVTMLTWPLLRRYGYSRAVEPAAGAAEGVGFATTKER